MLTDLPKPFEKATGVVEDRRRCTACDGTFPATHDGDRKCPHCHSTATVRLAPPAKK